MPTSQVVLSLMCGLGGAGTATGLVLIWMDTPGPRPKWILAFGLCLLTAGWLLSWMLDRRQFGPKAADHG